MKREMFYDASPELFRRAKELRQHMTVPEKILWEYLKTKPLGFKFRRQHPLEKYVADFFCNKLKLVIELDGLIHEKDSIKKSDAERQKIIEEKGIRVIRFTNNDICGNINAVIKELECLMQVTPLQGGRGGGGRKVYESNHRL